MTRPTREHAAQQPGEGAERSWLHALMLALCLALAGGVMIGALGTDTAAAADDGKAIFGQVCQGCHTMGGGKTVGPDLQGLADRRDEAWARQFILAPDEVIAAGDEIATALVAEYGVPMPNLGVTEAQVGPLLQFLGYAAQEEPPTEQAPTTPAAPASAGGAADRGEALFTGADRFEADGPSCLSCHAIAGVGALGGGELGPDLTDAYSKYGGAQGLDASLTTIPFPTMLPIFSRRALTTEERADLIAFLEVAPNQERAFSAVGKLVGFSVAAVVLLALLGLGIWRKRLAGVRKPLVNRARGK